MRVVAIKETRFWRQAATEWVQLLQNSVSPHGVMEDLMRALPWRVIAFFRIFESQNRIVPTAGKGYDAIGLEHAEFSLLPANNLAARCFSRRETIHFTPDAPETTFELSEKSQVMMTQLAVERAMAIPLIHGGAVVGVIYIGDDRDADFSDEAVTAVESIAPILASMISKQQLIEIMEHENQALHWMQEMSQVLLFVRNEEELWRQFRDMLIQLGRVAGGVYLVREGQNWRVHDVFGMLGPYANRVGEDTIQWVQARVDDSWKTRRVTWTRPGLRVLPPYVEGESVNGRGLRYYVGDENELLAVMTLYFAEPDTSVDRLLPSLLQTFSLAFQVIRQRRQLEQLSAHDALTGLGNRRALEKYMEAYLHRPVKEPLVLMLCDLDGFKNLNDTKGHHEGDQALRDIAGFLGNFIGDRLVACRLGGDEFILVLEQAKWSQKLLNSLPGWAQKSPLSAYGLTVTVGVVEMPLESENFTEAYRLADTRLYEGKRKGKNCVVGPTGIVALL